MSEPYYLIRIEKEKCAHFGDHITIILNTIQPFGEDLTWYMCGNYTTRIVPQEGPRGFTPMKIGNASDVIKLCKDIDCFRLPILLLAPPYDYGEILKGEYHVEDKEYRDLGDAVLEIRAFDVTYSEVYSSDLKVIEKLSSVFHSFAELNQRFPYLGVHEMEYIKKIEKSDPRYSRKKLGIALNLQLDRGYDVVKISSWAHITYSVKAIIMRKWKIFCVICLQWNQILSLNLRKKN